MPQRRDYNRSLYDISYAKFLCVVVSLWLFNFSVDAQEDSSKLFKPVTIVATTDAGYRIVIINSSIPHFVLNEQKLNDLAVTDIGSALRFIPGVQLKDYGGIGGIKTVTFRSLSATHTGVTVDGIRVPNVQSGTINMSSFEIFGVNEVAFTSGQTEENNVSASAYLNANSISIKSYLATRPQKLKLNFYSMASSISAFEEGVLVQLPVSKNVFVGAQLMTRFGKGDYEFIYKPGGITTPQYRTNSRLFNYKLKSVVGVNFKNSLTLFSTNYFNSEQELPGAMILYNPSNDQKMWNEDFRFSVLHDQKIGNWKLQLNGFYQSAWLRYFDPDFLNLQGFIDDTYLQENYGGGLMLKRAVLKSRLVLFAGSDLVYSSLNGSSLQTLPQRIENNSVAGLRTFFGKFKLESNLTMQFVSDKTGTTDLETTKLFNEFSPFVSLAWMPFKSEAFRVRSFFKRAFTLPTFNDLYYNFIGNTDLKPERANMYNVGVNYIKQRNRWYGEFSLDAFYNQVEDKIIAIPTKDLFNWSMQNIGRINAQGFDVSVLATYFYKKWKFTGNASYSYNLSLDVTDAESSTYQHQIPYTPFHSLSGGVNLDYRGYRLNTNLIYTGFRYTLNENIYANYLESFTDISVNVSKEFNLKNRMSAQLILAAQNILNVNYEVIKSFPMPGRYYQATLNLRLK